MDSKEDEEISVDFSKIKNFFKSEGKVGKNTEGSAESLPAENKDDEDISIDFGKIKNWFKSSEKEQEHSHIAKIDVARDDEEISFDFGKIKNIFKSDEKGHKADDAVPIDWGKTMDFFRKYWVVFIALIPIILSIYIRVQAGSLQFTDSWASSAVINNIKSQISASIDQQYPNLPDANKNVLAETELQKVISQNKAQIDQQIKGTSDYFKSFFQDENGKNYMADIDPYYWYRYAENIVDHGHPGDVLKDGKPFDNHQLAPLGRFVFTDILHSYLWAYFYKFLHFFVPSLTLMRSGFYLTLFFSALCVLLIFLIARKIAGNIGGFFAGLMMAVNGAFLSRSLHPDNDVSVVIFPLIVTWLFVMMIGMRGGFRIAILSVIAGFFTGLFTLAWSGWWYIFDFLLATIGITFVYLALINFNEIKNNIRTLISNAAIRNLILAGLLYFLSTLLFVVIFSGWPIFRNSFLGPLSFPSIKAPVSADLWPNVFTTVAELNEGSINGIINSIGGPFLFFISLLGLVLAIYRSEGMRKFDYFYIIGTSIFYGAYFLLIKIGLDIPVFGLLAWIMLPIFARICISIHRRDASYDFKLSILLSLWMASTIFASIKGIRFTVLLAPAFSVAFGVAIGKTYFYASNWMVKGFKVHRLIAASVLIVFLIGIFYASPTKAAINAARFDIPIVNDAWYNTLISIKQNSSENAIITSWWDFGHHFKAIADRPVTFDGTTQTSPAAHWVGKLLMTDNEEQAVGILRMLDCGGNNAFNTLYKTNNNTHLSLKMLNEIILLDKKEAEKRLKLFGFNKNQIEKILSFTHCEPPEAYFIASEDMIGKSGVWSHFGSWNFERAEIWQNRELLQEQAVEKMMKDFNYTKEMAENTYFEIQSIASDSEANSWVAPWPGYGGVVNCGKNTQGAYACSNGFLINISNYDVYAFGQQGIVRPRLAAFTTEDGLLKKSYNGTTVEVGVTVVPKNENEIEAVMSSKELAGSMFTRMFYMKGHGLKYFKLFNHQRGLTGTDIYTYKIDWEGKNQAIVEEYAKLLKTPVKMETGDLNLAQSNANSS